MTITIFHTNDFHNKLTDAQAERLRKMKEATPGAILLDCGDAIWSGNVYLRPGGEPILKRMNYAGYDAMCMGNREFHFMAAGLRHKIGWAEFPVLSANIRPTNGARLPVLPHITLERNGLRVTIMGLSVPMITERMLSRKVSSYVFDDPIETAARLVPELRPHCDLLVSLNHIGLHLDRKLAETVPGIDLIVGGHTHAVLESAEMVGETPIVQAGWYAHYVGKVKIAPEEKVKAELIELRG
jgi:2',3'-cyclic-nucleotide 2'-phosphodiesterase (5'-nucleotidase family)